MRNDHLCVRIAASVPRTIASRKGAKPAKKCNVIQRQKFDRRVALVFILEHFIRRKMRKRLGSFVLFL
ncbi:MAG TPA: hypothetical protein VFT90_00520, partial [Chryseosolibacter sp.]|nr:hypothetical protein [Chryseosolibacter sp.]